jgi:hypothetical protein
MRAALLTDARGGLSLRTGAIAENQVCPAGSSPPSQPIYALSRVQFALTMGDASASADVALTSDQITHDRSSDVREVALGQVRLEGASACPH